MRYPYKYISYLLETTEGENTIGAATQTYILGRMIEKECVLPMPILQVENMRNPDNMDPVSRSMTQYLMSGKLVFYLTNGIPFYLIMGQSTNTTPSYEQHVITGVYAAGSNKFDLPTFTLHVELYQTDGTLLVQNFYGCKAKNLLISGESMGLVKCLLEFNALSVSSSTWSDTALTTAPIVPAGSDNKPYVFPKMTFTYNSVEKGYVRAFTWVCSQDLAPIIGGNTSTPEYYKTNFPTLVGRAYVMSLICTFTEKTWLNDLMSATARTFEIKLIRTSGSDEIAISNTSQLTRGGDFSQSSDIALLALIALPLTVTVTVKDGIGSGYYPTQS